MDFSTALLSLCLSSEADRKLRTAILAAPPIPGFDETQIEAANRAVTEADNNLSRAEHLLALATKKGQTNAIANHTAGVEYARERKQFAISERDRLIGALGLA